MAGGKEGKYCHDSDWRHDAAKETPYTIYFYWVTPKEGVPDAYNVVAYMWVNDKMITTGTVLEELIKKLAANARDGLYDPRPIGSGFTVPWWRKSYFVLALPYADGFEPDNAFDIVHEDAGHDRPNHTFFDGREVSMKDAKDRPFSVAWTVNYMKTRHGEDLLPGEIHRFRLGFKAKGRPLVEGPDHGTNMGPPIGPP